MERRARQVFRSVMAVSALALFGLALPSHAATITTLYNTGVDSSGVVLADGTSPDPHYTLNSVPTGSGTTTSVITSSGGFPVGPWIGDSATSAWIGPAGERADSIPLGGLYSFRTTFDLSGLNPGTAQISGNWSTDNSGYRILINGNLAPQSLLPTGFTSYTAFVITSGFVAGLNTLDFLVLNDDQSTGNPVGLRVEMTGTASPVPLPAAAWLLLSGLVGFAALGRRRPAAAV